MPTPAERQDLKKMSAMFGTIAPRYDFVTRILSYGMDRRWKKLGVARATLPANARVLDLASGTGDFTKLVQRAAAASALRGGRSHRRHAAPRARARRGRSRMR